jgi:hypothetical protein
MTTKQAILLAFIFLPRCTSIAQAQNSSMTHVFPQIVDGVSSDGASFTSRFLISSIGGFPARCDISVFGMGSERLGTTNATVQPASWETIATRGQDVLSTGYARLDCSQPVFASLTYSLQSANGQPVGIATVSGAPVASHALIPMPLNVPYRYGIAIANDSDAPLQAIWSFTSNGTGVVRNLQVAARSHYIVFVDDMFSVPSSGSGTLEILANGSVGSGSFYITALVFAGGTFTNIVPAVVG